MQAEAELKEKFERLTLELQASSGRDKEGVGQNEFQQSSRVSRAGMGAGEPAGIAGGE